MEGTLKEMLVLDYSNEIENEIIGIHDGSFPLPDFSDDTYIQKKVLVNDSQIIGCGLVKLTTEFILILDKSKPRRVRVNAIQCLSSNIVPNLYNKGIKDIHVFVNDPVVEKYALHLGFKKCPERSALSLRFGY